MVGEGGGRNMGEEEGGIQEQGWGVGRRKKEASIWKEKKLACITQHYINPSNPPPHFFLLNFQKMKKI